MGNVHSDYKSTVVEPTSCYVYFLSLWSLAGSYTTYVDSTILDSNVASWSITQEYGLICYPFILHKDGDIV